MQDLLRHRHCDFHTSEQLISIGGEFDAGAWAQMLVEAQVDSVTCFACEHHGMIFCDTQAHRERRHPHLARNVVAEQSEAAHPLDIRVAIYMTMLSVQVATDGAIQGERG